MLDCSWACLIECCEVIDKKLIGELLAKAGASARLRQNLDLRTSGADGSQQVSQKHTLDPMLEEIGEPVHRWHRKVPEEE